MTCKVGHMKTKKIKGRRRWPPSKNSPNGLSDCYCVVISRIATHCHPTQMECLILYICCLPQMADVDVCWIWISAFHSVSKITQYVYCCFLRITYTVAHHRAKLDVIFWQKDTIEWKHSETRKQGEATYLAPFTVQQKSLDFLPLGETCPQWTPIIFERRHKKASRGWVGQIPGLWCS